MQYHAKQCNAGGLTLWGANNVTSFAMTEIEEIILDTGKIKKTPKVTKKTHTLETAVAYVVQKLHLKRHSVSTM